jgi:ferrous iron transport protein A
MQLSFKNGHFPSMHGRRRKTLAELEQNQEGTLETIDLPHDLTHRLMELGFIPGITVTAAQSAPGGDPQVFRVDGTEIALRRETARHMWLETA